MQGKGRNHSVMPVQSSEPPGGSTPLIQEVRWRFGAFTLWESQRRLERLGQPVRIGPRTFDLLLQLLGREGELVGKDDLLSTVWADVVVDEASVRVHMSLLRKVLGEPAKDDGCKEWITNIPLRGYRFNGSVAREIVDGSKKVENRTEASFAKLPARLTELVGRGAEIDNTVASLEKHRLVTLVGPGGIGKTSLAIHAAERFQSGAAAQLAFVDLAPLISPSHVVGTVARALGIAADLPDPVQVVIERVAAQDVLLLVDNCEHVIESLIGPLSRLLSALPNLRVLATSREALGITGEYVVRPAPLAVPDKEDVTLGQALEWPSVELLVERARAAGAGAFAETDGQLLARISRHLDGMPLAIELVAARLGLESVSDLAGRLDDHMRVLSIGNRSALERHRTLSAALDWSVNRLDDDEGRLFRRLSVFRAGFDAESALAVAAYGLDPDSAFDVLISLVGKSLVMFDGHDAAAPYRLLETTRNYAATLLSQSGERSVVLNRHATFMLEVMKAASAEQPILEEHAWGERYAHHLDDVRFAFETCLAGQPDIATAAALAMSSTPLWFHVSQVAEYRDWVVSTLRLYEQQQPSDPEAEAWLRTMLIIALLHTDALSPDLDSICMQTISDAVALKNPVLELQARWGQCTHEMFSGKYMAALGHSATLLSFVQERSEPAALNLAHRVSAMANHFCGSFNEARRHCDAALGINRGRVHTRTNMVGVDPAIAAMAMLARTRWVLGETTAALETATDAVSRAQASGHSVSLCAALYGACPVALWSGEMGDADRWVHMMLRESKRKGLVGWLRYAEWFAQGLRLGTTLDPRFHIHEVAESMAGYDAPRKEMLVTFCADWVDDAMLARVGSGEGLWSAAEAWRAAGWRSQQRGMPAQAEEFYQLALDTARQQGAKAWELRAAMSLAELWAGQQQFRRALALVDATCSAGAVDERNRGMARLRAVREGIVARIEGAESHVASEPPFGIS